MITLIHNPVATTMRKHVECENLMKTEMIEIINTEDQMIMDDLMIMIDVIHIHRDSQANQYDRDRV